VLQIANFIVCLIFIGLAQNPGKCVHSSNRVRKNDTFVPTLPIEKPAEYARNSAEIYSVQFILRFDSNFVLLRTKIEFQSNI
jgi:hypothetical protein